MCSFVLFSEAKIINKKKTDIRKVREEDKAKLFKRHFTENTSDDTNIIIVLYYFKINIHIIQKRWSFIYWNFVHEGFHIFLICWRDSLFPSVRKGNIATAIIYHSHPATVSSIKEIIYRSCSDNMELSFSRL